MTAKTQRPTPSLAPGSSGTGGILLTLGVGIAVLLGAGLVFVARGGEAEERAQVAPVAMATPAIDSTWRGPEPKPPPTAQAESDPPPPPPPRSAPRRAGHGAQ